MTAGFPYPTSHNYRSASLVRLADGAHLINVGRGAHVVEDDLLALLDAGKLGAATLDVFAVEPLPLAPPFWQHPKILVTPHVSAETQIGEAAAQIAAKLTHLARGEAVGGVVDQQRGYRRKAVRHPTVPAVPHPPGAATLSRWRSFRDASLPFAAARGRAG